MITEVSSDEFWQFVMGTKKDVMPRHEHPEKTHWYVNHTTQLVGVSYPGWRNPGGQKKFYLSDESIAEMQRIKSSSPKRPMNRTLFDTSGA